MDIGPVELGTRPHRTEKIRLGELLVDLKLVSPDQLKVCLEQHLRTGRKIGQLLVENGCLNEEELGQALACLYRAPYVDLKRVHVPSELVRRIPEALARRLKAIVLEERQRGTLVGFADPSDIAAYNEAARVLGRDIEIAVVAQGALAKLLDREYRRNDQTGAVLQFADGGGFSESLGDSSLNASDEMPVARLVLEIFEEAVRRGASDIHIEPLEDKLQVRLRVDGVLLPAMDADIRIAPALSLRLKLVAGLNISEKGLPQDGRFGIVVRDKPVEASVSTLPVQFGESIVLRILSTGSGPRTLDALGMPEPTLRRFRATASRASGLVLVTGPTGSGRTTTLYSALADLNKSHRKIITLEDPVECRVPGICQVQTNDKIDFSFGVALRSILRQDPDIVFVGEMRDQETALIAVGAAVTGRMVFSTLHAGEAVSTPIKLIDMGVPPAMAASALQAVLAQRLVRINCSACSEPYTPSAQHLAWVQSQPGGLPADATFRHAPGCSQCSNTGFLGRAALYELLEMNPDLVQLLSRNDPDGFMRLGGQILGDQSLQAQGVRLACHGTTTVGEVLRVVCGAGD
jgi:MSHA biogenesis protein MshE